MILVFLLGLSAPALAAQVSVHVTGVKDAVKDNVLASLSIAQYKDFGANPEATIRRLNDEAPDEIRHALQPFGYFSPEIDAKLTHQGEDWSATYRIVTGKPVVLRKVTVKVLGAGANDPVFEDIERNPALKTGAALNQQAYSQTKRLLQEAAAARGYLDAHFSRHELKVNPEEGWAEAYLVYRTGPRYLFGAIDIHQDILDPTFVHRYVHIEPGEPYDAGALADLQSALSASNYFSSVIVVPKRKQTQKLRVPIDVNTTPAKRNRFTVGAGYGTDTGPRLRFGWENRRINREGHRFRFDARVSRIETQAIARYIVPLANPATDRMVYSATLNRQDFGDTVSHLTGIGANRITQTAGGWQQSLQLDANRYVSDIGSESWTSRLLIPSVHFSRIVAHPATFPRSGYSVNANLAGAAKALASDTNFARADISARFIFPLGAGRLLLRGELGAIAASDFSNLPVALRFFTGGSNSVRGYAYQSLGPRNADGLVIGGRYLKVASVEYDFPVAGDWGIAGFFDAGSAADSFGAVWNKGIGIGVRYRTPIGAVRLDFAHPLDHPELGFYRIHLSIGLAL